MRYVLEFSYLGTNYHGWQSQPNAISVQEVMEKVISTLLKEPIHLVAAGRTDTGVHALQMFAHFDFAHDFAPNMIHRINRFLPYDIAVQNILKVKTNFHARFEAISRMYEYRINIGKNPFTYDSAWQFTHLILDLRKMNLASQILLNHSNFKSFAKLHSDVKTHHCEVYYVKWERKDMNYTFHICANRFLRNMVRSIVGTLVDVGKNKISIEEFESIIEKKDRSFASASAPAKGLYLKEVKYNSDWFE